MCLKMIHPCLRTLSIVRRARLCASNDRVAHCHNWSILALTSHIQLRPCSTMLHTYVNTFDKYVTSNEQMRLSMALMYGKHSHHQLAAGELLTNYNYAHSMTLSDLVKMGQK